MRKGKAWILAIVMMACAFAPAGSLSVSAENVKVSSQDYEVYYTGGKQSSFLCNKKTAGNAVGTEYYLTYTVESVKSSGKQNGVLGTCAPDTRFPYTDGNGALYYQQRKADTDEAPLLLEGYTYFIKFTVTKSGYRYLASRAKNDTSEYFVIERKAATGTAKGIGYGYFGLWFADGVTDAHLTKVRFYDKAGNDLGVWSPCSKATVAKSGMTAKDTKIDHWYRIEAGGLTNLAIANELPLTTDKMYIEYTVSENASALSQMGIGLSNYPDTTYPHGRGQLLYENVDENNKGLLLQPGAEYLITVEKGKEGFTAYIQITKNGKPTFHVFPLISGTYDPEAAYVHLWFGAGANAKADFVLENVKFYDSKSQNLGIQSNNSSLMVRHFGSMLDYAACEGVYYCSEDESMYTLYADQKLTYEKDGQKVDGTYSVRNNRIALNSSQEKSEYDYLYRGFTTKDDKYYKRLYTYKLSFMAGNGSEPKVQILDMEHGYVAKEPEIPKLEKYSFEGWCLRSGKAYEFDKMVTKSEALYAKWSDGAGITYLTSEDGELVRVGVTDTWVFVIVVCAVLLAATMTVSVLLIRGGKRSAEKEEKR